MSLDITPMVPTGRQLIQGYGDGQFRISEAVHEGPILVFPDVTQPWAISQPGQFELGDFQGILDAAEAPDILLLGCGVKSLFIHPDLRDGLKDAGIVLEPMDTGAACRTFNVLLGEDRRVAAALMPVD